MTMQPIHATAVARHTPAGWRGALIQGPSGVGKSDLALRLIGQGWRLIADDWTHLWASSGALYAAAPTTISPEKNHTQGNRRPVVSATAPRIGASTAMMTPPIARP